MRIGFYGAAGEVTGSCTLVEVNGARILVDCGAFQGGQRERLQNNKKLPFDAKSIDAVIVTHAHFDHCGRLPKLVAAGFRGPIFATAATRDLMTAILEDSLNIMEHDYEEIGVLPFFNAEHLRQTLQQVQAVKYDQWINSNKGSSFRLRDAGHILGSASVEIKSENESIIFSGDLGNDNSPIVDDTTFLDGAQVVIMESTYGMREHESGEQRTAKLKEALLNTAKNHGVLLIPSFAVERTQEILWYLHNMHDAHKLPNISFYLDSPLAIKINEIFKDHPENYDQQALEAYNMHHDFLSFKNLTLTRTVDESKSINSAPAPKVIIAGAGMMDGGRIMHHLKRYLPLASTTVLVVGFQPPHSLGRQILDGAKFVRIDRRFVPVHAKVIRADSYSAHADHNKLVKWLTAMKKKPRVVFLNHGERLASKEFANFLRVQYGFNTFVPKYGQSFRV